MDAQQMQSFTLQFYYKVVANRDDRLTGAIADGSLGNLHISAVVYYWPPTHGAKGPD